MNGEFLFEIGCEEIPARMLESARRSLQEVLEAELEFRGLLLGEPVRAYATPRRLVASCSALAGSEPDRSSQVVGPPEKVAYDEEGKPTRAAKSFAQRQGIAVRKLSLVETPKGTYVAAVSRQKGRSAQKVLAEVLPEVIGRISFRRTMYWTSSRGVRFIRPIRWLLALWAGKVIRFELDGIQSGNVTYGHRLLVNKPIPVRGISDYRRRLRPAKVLVEQHGRRAKIVRDVERVLKPLRLGRRADNELLDLLVNSVEYPSVVRGEFDSKFLAMPPEILVTVMRHHQRYFSVEDGQRRLVAHFVAVIDLDRDWRGVIRRGHEAVLLARFRDAEFFWHSDQSRSLEERVAILREVTFAGKVGSYQRKVERIVRLAGWFAEHSTSDGRRADSESVSRAARLSKADLTTEMVGEFPELQGVVGGLYAKVQNESAKVAAAIHHHYKPMGPDDSLPPTSEGMVLSLADKLDTVAACFAVGLVPSGSRDPYGLRRAGSGIVRVIVEKRVRVSLSLAVAKAVAVLQESRVSVEEATKLADAIESFLGERARHLFREVCGFPYDEVNAVFAAGWADLVDALARLQALRQIRPTADFEPVAAAFKRIRNILEQAGNGTRRADGEFDTTLMDAEAERELYHRFLEIRPRLGVLREESRYAQALREIASLRPQVDRFFDTVLVMAKEEAVRENRLTLLARLLQELSTVADFSQIVVNVKAKE